MGALDLKLQEALGQVKQIFDSSDDSHGPVLYQMHLDKCALLHTRLRQFSVSEPMSCPCTSWDEWGADRDAFLEEVRVLFETCLDRREFTTAEMIWRYKHESTRELTELASLDLSLDSSDFSAADESSPPPPPTPRAPLCNSANARIVVVDSPAASGVNMLYSGEYTCGSASPYPCKVKARLNASSLCVELDMLQHLSLVDNNYMYFVRPLVTGVLNPCDWCFLDSAGGNAYALVLESGTLDLSMLLARKWKQSPMEKRGVVARIVNIMEHAHRSNIVLLDMKVLPDSLLYVIYSVLCYADLRCV